METTFISKQDKNYSAIIHISAFAKYLIPFGGYIIPTVLWASKKNDSTLINHSGKQILNFQLSMLLYSFVLLIISIPSLIVAFLNELSWKEFTNESIVIDNFDFSNMAGLGIFAIICCTIFGILKITEFLLIIYGAVKTHEGEYYNYPFTINFFK